LITKKRKEKRLSEILAEKTTFFSGKVGLLRGKVGFFMEF